MPRSVPSYRLHKASGQAVVTLNGRDHYLGLYSSPESRKLYDRLISEWLSHGRRRPSVPDAPDLRLGELFAAYLEFARGYYTRDGQTTSEYRDMQAVLHDVEGIYGTVGVSQFGPLALKAARQRWIDRGFVRTRVNQLVNRVRRAFKWGVENEFVPPTVLHGLQAVAPLKRGRSPAPEGSPIEPVSDEVVDATLPFCSRQVAAMIQLQRLTGMRPGEVTLLRPADIDRLEAVWTYSPARHKTDFRGHSRVIFIGPKAQAALAPFLARPDESYCFSPAEAEDERNASRKKARRTPMTPSQRARQRKMSSSRAKRTHYDRDSYRQSINNAMKKAKKAGITIPHWHPHQLRHSCGSAMRRVYGLDVAQVVLGHKHARVTEIYAVTDHNRAKAAMLMLG